MDQNKAILNPENVCFNCLNESDIKVIEIHQMGYGSGFDGWGTRIQLCGHCYSQTNSDWWNLNVINVDEFGGEYEYEKEIFEFARALPLAGQELFYHRFSNGWNADRIWEPQDYIDHDLGILPHDKCKEYGVYSHEEINAYKTRFPTCQHPINVIYNDGSKGCECPLGIANGEYGQEAGLNIWDACHGCEYFTIRSTPIRDIKREDVGDYKAYYRAKLNQETYKNKFE